MKHNIGQLLFQKFQLLDDYLLNTLAQSEFGEISKSQSMIFACLGGGDMTISDVAKKLGISRQAAQKTISELVNRELLILRPSQENKSAKIVVLTPEGLRCVKLAQSTFSQIESRICEAVGSEKLKKFRLVLESDWKL
jgi:DNA-binding MarR family transcriptional regulator